MEKIFVLYLKQSQGISLLFANKSNQGYTTSCKEKLSPNQNDQI